MGVSFVVMLRPETRALQRFAPVAVGLALLVPAVMAAIFFIDSQSPPALVVAPRLASTPPQVTQVPVRRAIAPPAASAVSRVASVIQRPDQFDYGAWLWNANAASSGPVLITVDLHAQLIRVWRDGHEIGVSTILYGAPDSPTPLGTFPITQKDAHHVSNIFHSPMPYSLRLTNDGVMVHGSNVRAGWASNGCVGVPTEFAHQLFDVVKLGDRVLITDGKPLLRVGDSLPAL